MGFWPFWMVRKSLCMRRAENRNYPPAVLPVPGREVPLSFWTASGAGDFGRAGSGSRAGSGERRLPSIDHIDVPHCRPGFRGQSIAFVFLALAGLPGDGRKTGGDAHRHFLPGCPVRKTRPAEPVQPAAVDLQKTERQRLGRVLGPSRSRLRTTLRPGMRGGAKHRHIGAARMCVPGSPVQLLNRGKRVLPRISRRACAGIRLRILEYRVARCTFHQLLMLPEARNRARSRSDRANNNIPSQFFEW